jgi:3',5'-cyclic AMP phosphodiesterase CpdA
MKRGCIVLAIALAAGWLAAADTGAVRRVWVWSDAHVGLNDPASDGRDGAEWLARAAADLRQGAGPVAWMLSLGDICHSSQPEQFAAFGAFRRRAGIEPWFAVAGNHDYTATRTNLWREFVGQPRRFLLRDGNGVWICFGVERGGAGGRIAASTLSWLRGAIAASQGGNVIVCSHQAPGHTVARSDRGKNIVYCPMDGDPEPEGEGENKEEASPAAVQRVERLLDDLRVDLWLCGHIHSGARKPEAVARRGRTTAINVASISHAYKTGASRSYVLEFREGSRTVEARCRHHDEGRFDPAFSTTVEFPHPWRFTGPPKMEAKPGAE